MDERIIRADNPVHEQPTDVNELAIWWLSQSDSEILSDGNEELFPPDILPDYLEDEVMSRYGRPARGRLWVSMAQGFKINDLKWPDPETPLAKHCGLCGGIVLWRKDLPSLATLPGLVTDMNLQRL